MFGETLSNCANTNSEEPVNKDDVAAINAFVF